MLTPRQAAQRLGVSPCLIDRLCCEGVIPYQRAGRDNRSRIRIEEADIEHYRWLCQLDAAYLCPAHFFRSGASDQWRRD